MVSTVYCRNMSSLNVKTIDTKQFARYFQTLQMLYPDLVYDVSPGVTLSCSTMIDYFMVTYNPDTPEYSKLCALVFRRQREKRKGRTYSSEVVRHVATCAREITIEELEKSMKAGASVAPRVNVAVPVGAPVLLSAEDIATANGFLA